MGDEGHGGCRGDGFLPILGEPSAPAARQSGCDGVLPHERMFLRVYAVACVFHGMMGAHSS